MSVPSPPPQVLVVDDDPISLDVCAEVVVGLGYGCTKARDGKQAVELIDQRQFDVVLTDIRMPGCSGFEVVQQARAKSPVTALGMMTAYATVNEAVSALKSGVLDYVTKPLDLDRLTNLLTDLAAWNQEKRQKPGARGASLEGDSFHGLVGRSAVMQEAFDRILRAGMVDSTVLIQGDSGTGKELAARAIHACSSRRGGPFLAVDASSLSESLAESELFGHVKGAFTGAHESQRGILRSAEHGTVFLDEIGELPASIQAKLLRALQEKEVRPVGGVRSESYDARVIAATHRDLEQDVEAGTFRQDLFYRLHVIPVYLPPLRERREDIPLLAKSFLHRYAEGQPEPLGLSPQALAVLVDYNWPGNVRELENSIEHAYALREGPEIVPKDLPPGILGKAPASAEPAPAPIDDAIRPLSAYEEEAIRDALRKSKNNKREAARALGISVPTLYAKIRKYNIQPGDKDS